MGIVNYIFLVMEGDSKLLKLCDLEKSLICIFTFLGIRIIFEGSLLLSITICYMA